MFRYLARTVILVGLLCGLAAPALAHAIIVTALPASGAIVIGRDVDIVFAFNVRVDATRSKLTLTRPGGTISDVAVQPDPSPAVLAGRILGLAPGSYSIRWQVLATDGHITRGDIPFTVAP